MVSRLDKMLPPLFKPYKYIQGIFSFDGGWHLVEPAVFEWKNWRKSACILGRQHYVEVQKSYPMHNIYHLYKVIKAESLSLSSFSGKVLWAITGFKPGNWQVTYWLIPDDVLLEVAPYFKLVIPESLLLAQAQEKDGLYCFGEQNSKVFLYKQGVKFDSINADSLIGDESRFANLVNRYDLLPNLVHFSEADTAQLLTQQLASLPKYLLLGLWLHTKRTRFSLKKFSSFKIPALISSVLVGCYVIGVSWHLTQSSTVLDAALASKRVEMSKLLKQEQKVKMIKKQLIAYYDLQKANPGGARLINELEKASDGDMQVINIGIVGDIVTLRAVAPSATAIFRSLSELDSIDSVEFMGSISEDRVTKLEKFAVSFVLRPLEDQNGSK